MFYLRPAEKKDIDIFYQFSYEAGWGFSLPRNKNNLEEKIESSLYSFSHHLKKPKHETYYFVCEQEGKGIIGISALISRIGMSEPFYAYHNIPEKHTSSLLKIHLTVPVLHLISARKKPTESCSLFLQKEYRGKEYGKLLSIGRFLFMATFPNRFAPIVIAELRGVFDEAGKAPFWEAVGRHFFHLPYGEAYLIRFEHPECIEELFPKHPLYPLLLPSDAQKAIGVPYAETLPAWKILQKQGFKKSNYVDIFEAGPHVYAHRDEISAVKESRIFFVSSTTASLEGEKKAFIANEKLDYRATYCPFYLNEKKLILETKIAEILRISIGDVVRLYEPPIIG